MPLMPRRPCTTDGGGDGGGGEGGGGEGGGGEGGGEGGGGGGGGGEGGGEGGGGEGGGEGGGGEGGGDYSIVGWSVGFQILVWIVVGSAFPVNEKDESFMCLYCINLPQGAYVASRS